MAATSKLGTIDSTLLGGTLLYGASTNAALGSIDLTGSTSITFAPTADVNKEVQLTGATAITIAFPLVRVARTFELDGSNSVSFTVGASHQLRKVTGSNSFSITTTASPGTIARTGANAVAFSINAHPFQEYVVSANTPVVFGHTCSPGTIARTAGNAVEFTQRAQATFVTINGIVLTASHSITFGKTDFVSQVFASATQLDADTAITITGRGFFPIELTAANAFSMAVAADGSTTSGETTITFTQSAVVNREYDMTAETAVEFGQSFIYEQLRNGVPLTDITKNYNPFIGAGAPTNPDPPRLVPVGLTRRTDVVFFYPGTGPQAAATSSVTLRTPNFGDRDRQGYNIINRESRGGTLQIFRDDTWPDQRTLVMDFSNLKESEAEDMLTFLSTSVGTKVGFRDWQSRTWRGIITNPDTPIIRTRDDRIDISIEMQVDDTLLEMSASTDVTFALTNARVVEVP